MLFGKKKPAVIPFDRTRQTALLRISICTGERTLQFQDRGTGRTEEVACPRNDEEYHQLLQLYGLKDSDVKKYY